MLSENIKTLRKAKGLSQQELAAKLNVVRQTVSKWETGLSVPDADLLLALSQALDAPVSTLLGEALPPAEADPLRAISEKLEVINLQLARRQRRGKRVLHILFLVLAAATAGMLLFLLFWNSPYQCWDFRDPETAVAGAILHGLEWLFVRTAPLLLLGALLGAFCTRNKE